MYYLYHIPGKKIGVTCNLNNRVTLTQGYNPDETDQSKQNALQEGFDDGEEEGCGQKLLHLLQKMGVENG